ncbi:hypothetical protein CQ018_09555 [Arthrobacter sp. MYb227]|uniref:hypothetical protein n=1 Tax=Arthrobacter sp. MYb227 TaxID=1848601 RepID=UPI000D3F0A49|nr:hypothetical protein [Arthrobacter sp. MYb227]PQZ93878.1 hypothetical protein CQ018_09555 [Arthrobacter sp. MYb227]
MLDPAYRSWCCALQFNRLLIGYQDSNKPPITKSQARRRPQNLGIDPQLQHVKALNQVLPTYMGARWHHPEKEILAPREATDSQFGL